MDIVSLLSYLILFMQIATIYMPDNSKEKKGKIKEYPNVNPRYLIPIYHHYSHINIAFISDTTLRVSQAT